MNSIVSSEPFQNLALGLSPRWQPHGWVRLAILLSVGCALAGCSRQPAETSPDSQAVPRSQEEHDTLDPGSATKNEPLGAIAALAGRKEGAEKAAQVVTRADGWETEVFSAAAAKQLKYLCQLLGAPDAISTAKLNPFVEEQITSGPLRPGSLAEVFRDPMFVVLRLTSDPTELPASEGVEHFARSLTQLAVALRGEGELHTKAKVIRVTLTPTSASTLVHFSASRGRVGQNADWQCSWSLGGADQPPKLTAVRVMRFEETHYEGRSEKLFSEVTGAVFADADESLLRHFSLGIDHWRARLDKRLGVSTFGDHGVAVGDVNSDGREDLYLCQTGGIPNRLFVQQPDGTVRDVAAEAGVDFLDSTRAALMVDLDNDGDQDLLLSVDKNVLVLANVGDEHGPKFVLRAQLKNEAGVFSLAAADYDQDGDLDFFVCGYYGSEFSEDAPNVLGIPIPYHDANNGGRNTLWRNDSDFHDVPDKPGDSNASVWKFTDATQASGMEHNNHRFSFAASWEDYDNDGDLDLYVANDFGRNHLYRNTGGHFTDVAAEAGVEDITTGMSVTWGDYNNDGWMDVYVSNMFSSAGNRITYQHQFQKEAPQEQLTLFRRHARGNSLFENAGDGTFRDVSESAAVTMGRWAWSSLFMDMNNDGREDLLVGNGFITTEDTGDL